MMAANYCTDGLSQNTAPQPDNSNKNPFGVIVPMRSYHSDRYSEYNEWNFGLITTYETNWQWGKQCSKQSNAVFLGAYKNSVEEISVLSGMKTSWRIGKTISVGAAYGVITGYQPKILPLAIPTIDIHLSDAVSLTILPAYIPEIGAVIAGGVTFQPAAKFFKRTLQPT